MTKRIRPVKKAIPTPVVRQKKVKVDNDVRAKFDYVSPCHKNFPHVVKFSGGRSSGMLLFTLLNAKLLDASRGDIVVFNNTSAEHPATYEFVRNCKTACEKAGIPFLLTEFQTYEDASGGEYIRLPSYRLVNERPYCAKTNPNGYQFRGEVFQELISWAGQVPNQFQGRICTSWMKLFVSKEFLRDWFAVKEHIERLGHFGDESRLDADREYNRHEKNGGKTPKDIFLRKKRYCWSRPLSRPAAKFNDFSPAADWKKINNFFLDGKSLGGRVKLSGDFTIDYCSFVGFRGDEPGRLAKMRARLNGNDGENIGNDTDSYLVSPEGEHVYAPLMQFGKTKDDVVNFWKKHEWDLRLPYNANLSNCVYCFLKGGNALWHLANNQETMRRNLPAALRGQKNTPADIQWWVDLEKEYGRDLKAEGRKIKSEDVKMNVEKPIIGFFGLTSQQSYEQIQMISKDFKSRKIRGKRRKMYLSEFQALPCDCTD